MLKKACSLVILCHLAALSDAYITFQPNCTAPSTSVNFVSSNETRGTMDILWSCLFTIIACTWTVQHLNVPEQREDRDKGWLGDIKWALKRSLCSAKWMLVTAIAPEALITKCLGDRHVAKANFEELTRLAAEDEVPWSMSHSLFANMGGFVIRGNVPKRVGRSGEDKDESAAPIEDESTEAISNSQKADVALQPVLVGSRTKSASADVEIQSSTPSPNYPDPFHLISSDLVALRKAGLLTRLPFITTAELNDKSKSDNLVRVLAVVQILWMIIQVIVRGVRHLAVSQLEIGVVAFATCAVVIYCINWGKPKDVHAPYTILQYRGPVPQAVLNTLVARGDLDSGIVGFFLEGTKIVTTMGKYKSTWACGSPIPNHFLAIPQGNDGGQDATIQGIGFLLGGIVFGAIHTAAWDFVFPALIERTLWMASSIVCTAIPFAILIFMVLSSIIEKDVITEIMGSLVILLQLLYVAARIFLLVEIFRTLCFLPPTAYVATWAANVPHVA